MIDLRTTQKIDILAWYISIIKAWLREANVSASDNVQEIFET